MSTEATKRFKVERGDSFVYEDLDLESSKKVPPTIQPRELRKTNSAPKIGRESETPRSETASVSSRKSSSSNSSSSSSSTRKQKNKLKEKTQNIAQKHYFEKKIFMELRDPSESIKQKLERKFETAALTHFTLSRTRADAFLIAKKKLESSSTPNQTQTQTTQETKQETETETNTKIEIKETTTKTKTKTKTETETQVQAQPQAQTDDLTKPTSEPTNQDEDNYTVIEENVLLPSLLQLGQAEPRSPTTKKTKLPEIPETISITTSTVRKLSTWDPSQLSKTEKQQQVNVQLVKLSSKSREKISAMLGGKGTSCLERKPSTFSDVLCIV